MNVKARWLIVAGGAICVAAGMGLAARKGDGAKPVGVVAPSAVAPAWHEDLGSALAEARGSKRDVLVAFYGTGDARGPSTLESPDFVRVAGERFVLLRLVPGANDSPARMTQIATTAERLGVAHFPTYVLLDGDGKPYARSEVAATGIAEYLVEFRRLYALHAKRDEAIADAAAATGFEKARRLDVALSIVEPFRQREYGDLVAQLLEALPPGDASGLRQKYEPEATVQRADAAVQTEVYPMIDRGDYAGAITRIDRIISDVKPGRAELQLLLAFKGQLYFSLGDRDRAVRSLDEAIEVDPQSESAGKARAAKAQLSPSDGA